MSAIHAPTSVEQAHRQAQPMRVLVACEFSGIVRDAFRARGHDAWSCDLLPCEARADFHIQDDIRAFFGKRGDFSDWNLIIAFPPCTHLAVSGARWFPAKQASGEQAAALEFVGWFFGLPGKVAVENPVGIISTQIKRPTQIIQPWMFGHGEVKKTCLWLQGGLRPLIPTHMKQDFFADKEPEGRVARVHREPPGPDRWKNRSRTYQGFADAMAIQWGGLALERVAA